MEVVNKFGDTRLRRRQDLAAELWEPTAAVLAAAAEGSEVLQEGLRQLCLLVQADRADGGFVGGPDGVYRPARSHSRDGVETADFAVSADDALVCTVLASESTTYVRDIADDIREGHARTTMMDVGTRSILAHRLEYGGNVFGVVCLDWLGVPHDRDRQELELVDLFVSAVLSPVLLVRRATEPYAVRQSPAGDELSTAERKAVELAATGMGYREIAQTLGKSANTIDHQLLSARQKLGARNTVHLVELFRSRLHAGRRID